MKICPLVTQACILEDKDVLVREVEDVEPAPERSESNLADDSLFINPRSNQNAATAPAGDAAHVAVRFIAKSYRGRVECLGELCRFHDAQSNACRFDGILSRPTEDANVLGDIRAAVDQALKSHGGSSEADRAVLADLETKHGSRIDELSTSVDRKLDELHELIRTTAKERDESIEAFSLTLDARSEEIERKIESSAETINTFRGEIAGWREALTAKMDALESGFVENRQLVGELSRSHTGIMQVVECQKRNLEDEGRKRRTSEARRLNNAGVLLYHNGQYEKALDLFRKAVEVDPSMTEAYNNLGLTYTEMNEAKLATEAFRKAIEIEPDLAATYNNLGYVFYRLGSYTEAIEMYNEAIGRNKDNAAAYTNLGNAYYKMKRTDDAIAAWKKALEIDPANERARRSLKRFHAEVK